MTKPQRILKELEISEISLVDAGANEGAQVILWKRDVSKAAHAPSDLLGINLLRVLTNRVDNVKLEQDITRFEAWMEVLQSEEGKQLLELITKIKSDPSLIFKDMGDSDVSELSDFIEGPNLDAFVKALKGELKKGLIVQEKMEVVEKILKKDFESQIEATNNLKLELTKRAPVDDKRTPEKLVVDYLDTHSDVKSAIQELPAVVVTEEVEKRDFGPTYAKIQKLVDELIFKGEVSSRAKGFMKVVDSDPQLMAEYLKEQI